jgi:hypothetical protein
VARASLRLRSTAGRILGLDMLPLVLVGLLVLYADANNSLYYMDPPLAVLDSVSVGVYGEGSVLGEQGPVASVASDPMGPGRKGA